MNVEVRKSFTKDADKLPATIQRKLAEVIEDIKGTCQISKLPACKKLIGIRQPIAFV